MNKSKSTKKTKSTNLTSENISPAVGVETNVELSRFAAEFFKFRLHKDDLLGIIIVTNYLLTKPRRFIMTLQDYLTRNLQDLQLRGMAPSTQDDYVRAVRKISEYYNKLPDQITEDELREYFIYLKNVRKLGRSASTLAIPAGAGTSVRHQIFLYLHP